MKKVHLFLFFTISIQIIFSQTEYLQYRSKDNPLYWKNRKPHAAYWQQDVHYNIYAKLNDSTDIIEGEEEIIYWNNSPDMLNELFFHLYNNAQCKNSYLSDLYKNNNIPLKYGKYRANNLGTEILSIEIFQKHLKNCDSIMEVKIVNGEYQEIIKLQCDTEIIKKTIDNYEIDNTIMKVPLPQALSPDNYLTIKIKFRTYFDKEAIRNRMKLFETFGYKHYDIVHWYPRISVYDQKMRWDTQQHMDHEFYGEFGSFYVELSLPEHYILDGTGILINEKEVLPKELREKLNLSNFKNKPFNSPASVLIPKSNRYKTWKFSAINVHDVAYTADPTYRIDEKVYNGIRCIALVQEPHAAGWLNATEYMTKIIEVNSKNIGPYYYPKIICADAQDGMEYPMLTLDGGFDPFYRTLLIHEMTHNWFFGMLGSNETYRAFLDEGFTQFYTADTYQHIDGPYSYNHLPQNKYEKLSFEPLKEMDASVYNPYYNYVVTQQLDMPLNTHSDDFNGGIRHGGGYSLVYFKTATMLKNLEYVLGRKLFDGAIQHYFHKWKFAHPYPEDFRDAVIEYTKTDLNWFFDQWLETTKTIDYKISKVKRKGSGVYQITFKRKGEMQMPMDFTIIDKNDSAIHYHIPNNWFVKPTKANVLPRWIGWGTKLKPYYTTTISIGKENSIKQLIIDPSYRLADVDWTNNIYPFKTEVNFDWKVYKPANWKYYEMKIFPSLWYNGYDGIKVGANLTGDYLKYKHLFDLTFYFNTGALQTKLDTNISRNSFYPFSVMLNYKTRIRSLWKQTYFTLDGRLIDGLKLASAGFEKFTLDQQTKFYIYYKAMWRDQWRDSVYLLYPAEWTYKALNGAFHLGFEKKYSHVNGNGILLMDIRASAFSKHSDYSYIQLQNTHRFRLWKFDFNTRILAQYGIATFAPSESMLYVAGANPEDMMNNKYTRSMGIIPTEWTTYGAVTNHFSYGGGLNIRGYNGYFLPTVNKDGTLKYNYKGLSGGAVNAELEFTRVFSFLKIKKIDDAIKLKTYVFGDIGTININYNNELLKFSEPIADAGVGGSITVYKFGPITQIKPLTIRMDIPLFLNRLPYAEKDYIQFRWLLTVNRAF
ncbi:MAG: M1 family metallopeptidase [Bacteroidia bacterium]|nr:M1 family metallopeptidase [Bacteroidia bacterium]